MRTASGVTTSRRRRWTVLATALAVTGMTTAACEDNRPADAVLGSPVAAAATERAVRALEADPGFIGQVTRSAGRRPVCTARPMGISPDGTATERVETVYAWIYCKWIPSGATTPAPDPAALPALTSPIIVHLGDNLLYDLPRDGEERVQSIEEMFPANLRDAAVDGNPEESAAVRELDARVARELAR